jgi:S-adenosylmethionine synthetase
MINHFIFTSESVTEGHPDKLCDQISDAVVDHFLSLDPSSQIRCECAVSGAIVFIAARFNAGIAVDFTRLARKVIKRIGYDQPDFNPMNCSILTSSKSLEEEKHLSFDENTLSDMAIDEIPAKNQVTVFGYAVNESSVLMPFPIFMANRMTRQLSQVRKDAVLPYLLPDGKIQVGVEYHRRTPVRIHSITLEVYTHNPHKPDVKTLGRELYDMVVVPAFAGMNIQPDNETLINVNPDGPYLGGPLHHSGLTGRKNAVDTYGEYTRHSGKALSGKDPLRVDRIGAYAARYAAKNIVAAQLADVCEVMVSYGTGRARPVSLIVNTFGTGRESDHHLAERVGSCFEFRPAGILKAFKLRHLSAAHPGGFFQKLSSYGHFGREDIDLPWEKTDKINQLSL